MTTSERLRDATTRVVTGNLQTQTELGEYSFLINALVYRYLSSVLWRPIITMRKYQREVHVWL